MKNCFLHNSLLQFGCVVMHAAFYWKHCKCVTNQLNRNQNEIGNRKRIKIRNQWNEMNCIVLWIFYSRNKKKEVFFFQFLFHFFVILSIGFGVKMQSDSCSFAFFFLSFSFVLYFIIFSLSFYSVICYNWIDLILKRFPSFFCQIFYSQFKFIRYYYYFFFFGMNEPNEGWNQIKKEKKTRETKVIQ